MITVNHVIKQFSPVIPFDAADAVADLFSGSGAVFLIFNEAQHLVDVGPIFAIRNVVFSLAQQDVDATQFMDL